MAGQLTRTFVIVACTVAGDVCSAQRLRSYLDRSYYTMEETAQVVCSAGEGQRLVVSNSAGSLLGSHPAEPTCRIRIPLAALPTGEHSLTVRLQDRAGDTLASCELALRKRTPKPGCEWKIDQVNRVILRNGKPFFPYGMIMPGNEADFRSAAEIGLNTVHTWSGRRPLEMAEGYVKHAEKYGVFVIPRMGEFCQLIQPDIPESLLSGTAATHAKAAFRRANPKKVNSALIFSSALRDVPLDTKAQIYKQFCTGNQARLAEAISRMKDHPRLVGYFLFDEPVRLSHIFGKPLYQLIHETDGYHPAFVVYSSSIPKGEEYVDWMDVIGTDPYWTPGSSGVRGNVNYVSRITCLTDQRAAERRQVTWIVPMAEYWSGIRKRAILPKEQFCQTYLTLIHGAKAIIYFRWPFKSPASLEAHKTLAKHMKLLGPIAVTPDIPQTIAYEPGELDVVNNKYPDVQVSLRRRPEGGYVLLAANSRYYPVDVTYRISLLRKGTVLRRLFGEGTFAVKNGAFSDRVEFMGTRAYAFQSDGPSSGPVKITVTMSPRPDETDQVYGAPGYPDTGRPGKRNLLRNPGFEEAGLPNWPDYYLFPGGCTIDTQNPYEGVQCLRIEAGAGGKRVYAACSPKLKEPTDFVLSAHLRADRPGLKVKFVGFGWLVPKPTFGYKDFELTTEWKRYSEQGTLPTGLPNWHSVGVLVHGNQEGAVYVDALQMEKGQTLTEYDP